MIDTIYLIPTITSHTNGGGYGEFYSITSNKDEMDEYLSSYDDFYPGTTTDDGEYLDDDYFTQTYLDPTEDIIGITDPDHIDRIINSDTFIYGFSSIIIDSETLDESSMTLIYDNSDHPDDTPWGQDPSDLSIRIYLTYEGDYLISHYSYTKDRESLNPYELTISSPPIQGPLPPDY